MKWRQERTTITIIREETPLDDPSLAIQPSITGRTSVLPNQVLVFVWASIELQKQLLRRCLL
jgi:hypothetical protein